MNTATAPVPRPALRDGLLAARENAIPGILLWLVGAGLVTAYYRDPSFARALEHVATLKVRYGYAFSAVSTALFGGVIPFLYLRLSPRTRAQNPWRLLVFYTLLWSYRGVEVDFLYRVQAMLFGVETIPSVIALKVAADQFVYTPFWSAPGTALVFAWRDEGFNFSAVARKFSFKRLVQATVRMVIPTWLVWIPAVAVIYAFPLPLQVPLFNLVLCFFMLLLAALPRSE